MMYRSLNGRRFSLLPEEKSLDDWSAQSFFYGKAGFCVVGGVCFLRSYDTIFAAAYRGTFVLTSEFPFSVTTRKHVRAFCRMLGIKIGTTKADVKKMFRCEIECSLPTVGAAECIREFVDNLAAVMVA